VALLVAYLLCGPVSSQLLDTGPVGDLHGLTMELDDRVQEYGVSLSVVLFFFILMMLWTIIYNAVFVKAGESSYGINNYFKILFLIIFALFIYITVAALVHIVNQVDVTDILTQKITSEVSKQIL
jgi:hypothetical protein